MSKPSSIEGDINDYAKLCFFADIAKAIARSNTIDQTLDAVMQHVVEIFTPEHWSLLLLEPDSGSLKFSLVGGSNADKLTNHTLPKEEGVAGWVVNNRKPVIIEDVNKDRRFSANTDKYTDFTTQSIIGVPLLSGERVFGVIELINKICGTAFTPYELKVLSVIGDFAGIAIEKAYYSNTLKKLARVDPMTGLYNRGYFEHCLRRQVDLHHRYQTPVSLIMIDVDNFKYINDNYGHPAGDEVLKALAKIVLDSIRQVDIACRYGGDEFIVILPSARKKDCQQVRERIRLKVGKVSSQGNIPPFSASIGLHEVGDEEDAAVLTILDNDLYHEKENKPKADIHCVGSNVASMLDEERSATSK